MATDVQARLRDVLAMVAPGTPLRDGLERILRGRTGALLVLGLDRSVDGITRGGFELDIEFTANRLRELAKMDGAIVLDDDATRILRAAVHLHPDPTLPTDETGTRHSAADRVSRQTHHPTISVSESMSTVTIYVEGRRHVLEDSSSILARANQAIATLERYRMRLDEVSANLSALEIDDLVTVRDVAVVAQRGEMVLRIALEIQGYVIELGTDGRLLSLQLAELLAGVGEERSLVLRDYATGRGRRVERAATALDALDGAHLLDLVAVARALGFEGGEEGLDQQVSTRGYRQLARIPRLPDAIIDRLVTKFGSLPKILAASTESLQAVDGVGEQRARSVREGLSRLSDGSLLERYS
jgi:diadenylate cyclase